MQPVRQVESSGSGTIPSLSKTPSKPNRSGKRSRSSSLAAGFITRRASLIVTGLVVAGCALFGGSARADTGWLLVLRPLCIFALAVFVLLPTPADQARSLRVPLVLLACFAGWMVLQLVPLPADVWPSLPGHERFGNLGSIAGLEPTARPISLAPWLTWNSILAVLPALAMLAGLRLTRTGDGQILIIGYLAMIAASALLGILQVSGAMDGPPLQYRFIHKDSALGFFANRNHSAVFLATAFPVLRLWVETGGADPATRRRRATIALLCGVFLLPVILVTGSRSGMAATALAIATALAMHRPDHARHGRAGYSRYALPAIVTVLVAVAAFLILFGKAVAVNRLFADDMMQDLRLRFLPVNMEIIRDFFPFGSGLGTFDTVFRIFEPDWALARNYFNNAHNDLVELAMTGGLPALLVLAAFIGWVAMRFFRTGRSAPLRDRLEVRAGAAIIAIWFVASLTDYPLRTPLAGAMFVFAVYLVSPRKTAPALSRSRSAEAGA